MGKGRRVGQGMKPRGTQEQSAPKPVDAVGSVDAAPITEGQPESLIQPILDAHEQVEKGKVVEDEKLQILESAENVEETASVAQKGEEMADVDLEKALQMSGGEWTHCAHGKPICGEPCEECKAALEAIQKAVEKAYGTAYFPDPPLGMKMIVELGLQPDGSYKLAITIPEGYWEPVKQWAEADNLTPEEWVNQRFTEYIETWAMPAGKR